MSGTTIQCMTANGLKTKLMEKGATSGPTAGDTKENGRTTTCTARVFILGKMAESMKVNI
jgi:hypothetical protein